MRGWLVSKNFMPPRLPREHGAWAMLAIPLLLGAVAAGRPTAGSIAIVPAMVLLFLARYAALPAMTRWVQGRNVPEGYLSGRLGWSGIYLLGGAIFLIAAVAAEPRTAGPTTAAMAVVTGILGTLHAGLALGGLDRTLWGESIGLAALASAAPLVMVAAGRPLDGRAASVGALCLGYFVTSLAWVRAYRTRAERGSTVVLACVAIHVAVLAAMLWLGWRGWLPAGMLVAWVPVIVRTAWGLARPPAGLRAAGWREMAVAASFVALAAAALGA